MRTERLLWYVLEGHEPVSTDDRQAVDQLLMDGDRRRVARDKVEGAEVSTVFLCLDHNFAGGPPLLFETLVFGGPLGGAQRRYATWADAERGHAKVLAEVRDALARAKRRRVVLEE